MKPSLELERARQGDAALSIATDRILIGFWVSVAGIVALLLYAFAAQPSWRVIGGAAIICAALVPSYLWCIDRVPGVPVFPVFAITFIGTYAYPLVSGHPIVLQYSEEASILAGAKISFFLLIATATWYFVARAPHPAPRAIRAMAPGRGDYLFSSIICGASVLTLGISGVWFSIIPGVFSIIRAALFGLSSVGIFVLAYRWGRREMDTARIAAFVGSLALYLVSQLITLFLITAIVATVLALAAFVFGRRELPWKSALLALCLFSVLHAGKADMRERYWYPEPLPIQVWHFPVLAIEWLGAGLQAMATAAPDDESQPLYERLSLVHLLLKVQEESPDEIPYLHGESYAVIPYLLVPRVLNPEKLAAHEGTTILNVHYGLQTREDTEKTTIGWGLVNEAAANFGLLGIVVLAVLIGIAYGWVTRIALGMPVLSLRTLIAITFAAFAAQTEFTAGVYVSALFQSLVSLFAMSFVFMERRMVADDR